MTSGLKRYHQSGCSHFITFRCYRRQALLYSPSAAGRFQSELERVRQWYGLRVYGYVVMPEHVHLLVSEPDRTHLSIAIQMLKQQVSRKLRPNDQPRFWQVRYYDSLLKNHREHTSALHYFHRNPVTRGLCAKPEDWEWSSFRHYTTGKEGAIEIESEWTGRRRERLGCHLVARLLPPTSHPSPQIGERVGHASFEKK
jgi:putative transposase